MASRKPLNWATETQEQITVASYCDIMHIPMYHIPNEAKRSVVDGRIQNAMGRKKGVPDICIPVARGGFHGLYIELKSLTGKPTQEQKQWLKTLTSEGYRATICYGAAQAIEEIKNYMKGTRT